MADDEKKADDRIDYLRGRILGAFKHLKADRIEKGFNAPESMCVRWVARAARCRADVRCGAALRRFRGRFSRCVAALRFPLLALLQ